MLRVLGQRMLIDPIVSEVDMPGELVAPDSVAPMAPTSGIVAGLGDRYQGPIQLGDVVAFSEVAGQDVVFDGDYYLIVPASEILAVITPSTAQRRSKE